MHETLKQTSKNLVRRQIARLGLDVQLARNILPEARDVYCNLVSSSRTSIVLDVGANHGEFAGAIRKRGFAGTILSFEPRREAFEVLSRRAKQDPLWECRQIALGDSRQTVEINIAGNGVSSSVLQMERGHIAAEPGSAYIESEVVLQERLDDAVVPRLAEDDTVGLKIDVQGYEGLVLAGAQSLLERTTSIHIELALAPVYVGQPDWRSITDDLTRIGFELYTLEPVFVDRTTGRTLQVDAVFSRTQRETARPL